MVVGSEILPSRVAIDKPDREQAFEAVLQQQDVDDGAFRPVLDDEMRTGPVGRGEHNAVGGELVGRDLGRVSGSRVVSSVGQQLQGRLQTPASLPPDLQHPHNLMANVLDRALRLWYAFAVQPQRLEPLHQVRLLDGNGLDCRRQHVQLVSSRSRWSSTQWANPGTWSLT